MLAASIRAKQEPEFTGADMEILLGRGVLIRRKTQVTVFLSSTFDDIVSERVCSSLKLIAFTP